MPNIKMLLNYLHKEGNQVLSPLSLSVLIAFLKLRIALNAANVEISHLYNPSLQIFWYTVAV